MDRGLGTDKAPSVKEAVKWISASPCPAVIMSVHKDTLAHMARLRSDQSPGLPSELVFIYLYKTKERLKQCLGMPTAEGHHRPEEHVQGVLDRYEEVDNLFRTVAHYIIDTNAIGLEDTAREIKGIAVSIEDSGRAARLPRSN